MPDTHQVEAITRLPTLKNWSKFTSAVFTGVLKRGGNTFSVDRPGRTFYNIFVELLWHNVKYEDVYLKGYGTVSNLLPGLIDYFVLYNRKQPHQAPQYKRRM